MNQSRFASLARPSLRALSVRLIVDSAHHDEVIERGIRQAKTQVWIATANFKDIHVAPKLGTSSRASNRFVSLFAELTERAKAGLDVRILTAGAPSVAMKAELRKGGTELVRRCPRVHTKLVAIDGEMLYLGSANFTGAGLGAKSNHRRNFEAGIVTDCPLVLDEMQAYFDAIWQGKHCASCQIRAYCPSPIDRLGPPSHGELAGNPAGRARSSATEKRASKRQRTPSEAPAPLVPPRIKAPRQGAAPAAGGAKRKVGGKTSSRRG